MGGQTSKRTSEGPLPITMHRNSQYSTELSSCEKDCNADSDLQIFNTAPQARATNGILRTLSFNSLRQVAGCLLEMGQDVVEVILECKKETWKNQELFDLVEEYFEESPQTLAFCIALEKWLKRAWDSHSLFHVALQQFKEESAAGENKYARTLEELKNFKAAGDPLTQQFLQIFQSVYRNQIAMLEQLQTRKSKIEEKIKSIRSWKKLSSTIFSAAFTGVLICSIAAAPLAFATPSVAGFFGAVTSIPIRSVGKWIDSLLEDYENALKGQKGVINAMQAGTYVAIQDLDNIRVLVDRLEIEVESLLKHAEFAIENDAVKVAIEEMGKTMAVLMKHVQDLGAQAEIFSSDIRRARTVIMQRIIKHLGD